MLKSSMLPIEFPNRINKIMKEKKILILKIFKMKRQNNENIFEFFILKNKERKIIFFCVFDLIKQKETN